MVGHQYTDVTLLLLTWKGNNKELVKVGKWSIQWTTIMKDFCCSLCIINLNFIHLFLTFGYCPPSCFLLVYKVEVSELKGQSLLAYSWCRVKVATNRGVSFIFSDFFLSILFIFTSGHFYHFAIATNSGQTLLKLSKGWSIDVGSSGGLCRQKNPLWLIHFKDLTKWKWTWTQAQTQINLNLCGDLWKPLTWLLFLSYCLLFWKLQAFIFYNITLLHKSQPEVKI